MSSAAPAPDIRLGNCVEVLADVPNRSVDLLLTDPPYMRTDLEIDSTLTAAQFCELLDLARDKLTKTVWLFVFGPVTLQAHILNYFSHKFSYTWIKPNSITTTYNTVRPRYQHEPIEAYTQFGLAHANDLYFDREALRTYGHSNYTCNRRTRKLSRFQSEQRIVSRHVNACKVTDGSRSPTTILKFDHKGSMHPFERTAHPTQKPVSMLRYLIEGYCPPGGLVMDPFLGSGSTAAAAQQVGRRFVGAEIDPQYYEVAVQRCSPRMAETMPAALKEVIREK